MASNIKDVTINYEEDGVLVIKELDKGPVRVLGTVLYKYRMGKKE